jgi:hypothetical protein
VRPVGDRVPRDDQSEGTADQIFLALRIAALAELPMNACPTARWLSVA